MFSPDLVPGKSIVVLQDFKHMPTYWIPLVFGSRPDLWEELHDVQKGDTSTFRLRAPLDAAAGSAADYTNQSFSVDEVRLVFAARLERPGGERLRMSFYRALLESGCKAEADSALAKWLAGASGNERSALEQQAAVARSGWRSGLLPVVWKAIAVGEVDRAEQLLLSMQAPEDPYCATALARVAQLRGDDTLALDRLQPALTQQPQPEAAAILFAATSHASLGDHERAVRSVLELVRSRPQIPRETKGWAFSILLRSWDQRRDVQMARSDCRELLATEGDNPDALVLAARVDKHAGELQSARERLGRALLMEPTHLGAKALLAAM